MMGYRVEYNIYGKTKVVNMDKEKHRKLVSRFLVGLIIMGTLMHGIAYRWIWNILFPGSDQHTEIAAENLIAQIREGEPVGNAVAAFCKEIVTVGR